MHGDEHMELHGAIRHFRVDIAGLAEDYFLIEEEEEEIAINEDEQVERPPDIPVEVVARLQHPIFDDNDIALFSRVMETDSDKEPAPENIPTAHDDSECIYEPQWGHDGICNRKKTGVNNTKANRNFPASFQPSIIDTFELFFPTSYVKEVMLPTINKSTTLGTMQYGEFLRWIGLWFLMATVQGPSRIEFWRKESVDIFNGAPFRLNEYMSKNRFEDILAAMAYTDDNPPAYVDKFHCIRKLIAAWNTNMHANFTPGWVNCLDESMSVWTSQWTCPGHMFVPRKPHPMGNEYHSICCGLSGIMFGIELVEGKDHPVQLGPPTFDDLGGKTVGLLIRLTEKLWHSGKVVVLDSGFCVLKGLIQLRQKGVFAAAVIKKRRYWPKYIKGDEIRQHFDNQQVGDANALAGTLNGVPFHLFAMKEPDYVMTLMSTYGTMERIGKETERVANRQKVKFQYPEVFHNHFKFRHQVDDHNNRRHSPISFEENWATKRWENRVFAFLLAITEVNVLLSSQYFDGEESQSQIAFRKKLAWALIYNKYIQQETQDELRRSKRKSINLDHEYLTLPVFSKFSNGKVVRSNMKYPQFKCNSCKKKIRTYCRCSPGVMRCIECYAIHVREVDIEVASPYLISGSRNSRHSTPRS